MIRTAKFGTSMTSVYPGNVAIVSTTPYNVAQTDVVIAVDATTTAVTVNLPLIATQREVTVVDYYGLSMSNNIIIHPYAGNTIMHSANDLIVATSNLSVTLRSISETDWMVVSRN